MAFCALVLGIGGQRPAELGVEGGAVLVIGGFKEVAEGLSAAGDDGGHGGCGDAEPDRDRPEGEWCERAEKHPSDADDRSPVQACPGGEQVGPQGFGKRWPQPRPQDDGVQPVLVERAAFSCPQDVADRSGEEVGGGRGAAPTPTFQPGVDGEVLGGGIGRRLDPLVGLLPNGLLGGGTLGQAVS